MENYAPSAVVLQVRRRPCVCVRCRHWLQLGCWLSLCVSFLGSCVLARTPSLWHWLFCVDADDTVLCRPLPAPTLIVSSNAICVRCSPRPVSLSCCAQCGADSLSGDRLGCFNLSLKGTPLCFLTFPLMIAFDAAT